MNIPDRVIQERDNILSMTEEALGKSIKGARIGAVVNIALGFAIFVVQMILPDYDGHERTEVFLPFFDYSIDSWQDMSQFQKTPEIPCHVQTKNSVAAERHDRTDQPDGLSKRSPYVRTGGYSSC